MAVAMSRLADLLTTGVAVAFDVDTSGISNYCDILPEGACIARATVIKFQASQRRFHAINSRWIPSPDCRGGVGPVSAQGCRVAHPWRRSRGHQIPAAGSDQCIQLQQA